MATFQKRGSKVRALIRRANHKPISRTFNSVADAKRWARRAESDLDRGKAVDAGSTTFGKVVGEYMAHIEAAGRVSRSKRQAIEAIRRDMGHLRLRAMTTTALTDYAASRRRQGAGAATIGQDLSYIGTVLRHGSALLEIDASQPLAALDGARRVLSHSRQVSRSQERTRRPAGEELAKLFDYWDGRRGVMQIPMSDLVRFAIASAMRLGEIVRLEWADLDEAARTILIRDRKHPKAKAGNDQRVPLVSSTGYDALALIQAQSRRGLLIWPYQAASVSTAFTRACKAHGVKDLHFHDLRHEGVSRLFEAGFSIEQVAAVSGHRDWNMLRRYLQLKPEHVVAQDQGNGRESAEVVLIEKAG